MYQGLKVKEIYICTSLSQGKVCIMVEITFWDNLETGEAL